MYRLLLTLLLSLFALPSYSQTDYFHQQLKMAFVSDLIRVRNKWIAYYEHIHPNGELVFKVSENLDVFTDANGDGEPILKVFVYLSVTFSGYKLECFESIVTDTSERCADSELPDTYHQVEELHYRLFVNPTVASL